MLNDALIRYIELRRSLGFKLRSQYVLLRNFVEYATANGDDFIRAERVLNWAILAPSAPQRRNRLLTVRRFATASRMEDPRHELPAADAMGRSRFRRRLPYIYQPEDIERLIREASLLKPSGTLRPLMYSNLFGLLAATGMRVSEALSLRLDDVTSNGLCCCRRHFDPDADVQVNEPEIELILEWPELASLPTGSWASRQLGHSGIGSSTRIASTTRVSPNNGLTRRERPPENLFVEATTSLKVSAGVAGWLAGFPVVAGPILFLLALDNGRDFAGQVASFPFRVIDLADHLDVCASGCSTNLMMAGQSLRASESVVRHAREILRVQVEQRFCALHGIVTKKSRVNRGVERALPRCARAAAPAHCETCSERRA